jgi:outer membrane protein TolC
MEKYIYFVLVLALILPGSLYGEGSDDELHHLLREALQNNPAILAAQKRYEAARQRPTQASSLPDPVFSPQFNSSGRPWPGAGLGKEPVSQIGFMISQELPFPGKRRLSGAIAAKEAAAEWQGYQQAQLKVVSQVKQAYYARSYAFAATEVIERHLEFLQKLLRVTEARYAVGKAPQQDVFKVQTQISILEARRLQLEQEKRAREAEINSLVSRRAETSLPRPPLLRAHPLSATLEQLYAAARENSPLLRSVEQLIQRSELEVNLARKQYYPDFTLNGGYYNMGGMPDMYMFRVDFKAPLYFFRKQRPAVTEHVETLNEARGRYEATRRELYFRLQDDYLMAQTAERLAQLYSQTVIPQASLALESSLASYETGGVDLLTVLMNYITAVNYEMNYFEELRNFYLALSRLEEVAAVPLIP